MAGLFSIIFMTTVQHQGTLNFLEMAKCFNNTENNNNNIKMAQAPRHYAEICCNS